MNAASVKGERGTDLLLRHCLALTDEVERPRAYERLQELVGDDFARMLVLALAGPRRDKLAA
jgi:hypothetical protein